MIATHYNVDFSEHYMAEYLAARGIGFLGWNTGYRGAEPYFLLEQAVIDIGAGVGWLRAQGVEIRGRAELRDDPDTTSRVTDLFCAKVPEEWRESARATLTELAAERIVVAIKAEKVNSWDHAGSGRRRVHRIVALRPCTAPDRRAAGDALPLAGRRRAPGRGHRPSVPSPRAPRRLRRASSW